MVKMDKVRIFITDWQILFREGIHFTLSGEDDFEIVGEATNNTETLELIEKDPPSIAILNMNHTKPSGIDITRYIKQNLPGVKVVLMMDKYNIEHLFAAIKAGARACLSKDVDLGVLLRTIRQVVQGESPISQYLLEPDIASRIILEFEVLSQINDDVSEVREKLTRAEEKVLNQIKDGNSPIEITQSLDVAEEKVQQYLDVIVGKLVANDLNREVMMQVNLNNGISRISGEDRGEQMKKEGAEETKDTGDSEELVRITTERVAVENARQEVEAREAEKADKEKAEPDANEIRQPRGIDIKMGQEINEVVKLAREAERLATLYNVHQDIKMARRTFIKEIAARKQALLEAQKAIKAEIELGQEAEITWKQLSEAEKADKEKTERDA